MPDEDTATLIAETIAEAEVNVRKQERKAAEGDELYRAALPAGEMVRRKQNTMVRSGDTALPERIRFYRSQPPYNEAWLPTAQLAHHLRKKHEDGTAVFVKTRPEDTRVFIEDECEVCAKNNSKPKQFYEEFDFISHMDSKHPREWRIIQQRDEKKAGNFLTVLMNMDPTERAAVQALLGGSNGNSEATGSPSTSDGDNGSEQAVQSKARIPCPDCGKSIKPRGLSIHQGRYCSARVGAN